MNSFEPIYHRLLAVMQSDLDASVSETDGVKTWTVCPNRYHFLSPYDFEVITEGAAELFTGREIADMLEVFLRRRRADGWLPNYVGRDIVTYQAGNNDWPWGKDCLGSTMYARTFARAVDKLPPEESESFYRRWEKVVCRGAIDLIPKTEDGLVWNDPMWPHTVSGWTDIICKTGILMHDSLELWRALKCMIRLKDRFGDDSGPYRKLASSIEASLLPTFLREDGMLNAATGDCRQLDVWQSAYAVAIGFPMTEQQRHRIRQWIADHYDEITLHAHFRHLPAGEFWEKQQYPPMPDQPLTPNPDRAYPDGVYMNGGYWSLPCGWMAETLYPSYPELVERMLAELCDWCEAKGSHEWIGADGSQIGYQYPACIAGPLAAARHLAGLGKNVFAEN